MISNRNGKGIFEVKAQERLILDMKIKFLKEKQYEGFFKFFNLDYYFGDYDANTTYAIFLEDGSFIIASEEVIYGKMWNKVDQGEKYTWYEQIIEKKYQLYGNQSDQVLVESIGIAPWQNRKLFDMNGKQAFAVALSNLFSFNQIIISDYDIALVYDAIRKTVEEHPELVPKCFQELKENILFNKLREETTVLGHSKESGPQLLLVDQEVDMDLLLPTFSKQEMELSETIKQEKRFVKSR